MIYMSKTSDFRPYHEFTRFEPSEMVQRAEDFYTLLSKRRSVRSFSSEEIPDEVLDYAIKCAGTAPNGANKQPWHFVIVKDPQKKREIRIAAEKEEHLFYNERAPEDWLADLEQFDTNEHKPFIEEAPALIAIFSQSYHIKESGKQEKHYYVKESVGIATGMLITALHQAGLATLTHTPSPMGFLNELLGRPKHEKAFLLLVCGYPKEGVEVPNIQKKPLNHIRTII